MTDDPSRKPWWQNAPAALACVTLLVLAYTAVTNWNTVRGAITNELEWRLAHEKEVEERRATNAATAARFTLQTDALRDLANENRRLIDAISFRVQALEAKAPLIDSTVSELRKAIADQAGDLKVIREILVRLEQAQKDALKAASGQPL